MRCGSAIMNTPSHLPTFRHRVPPGLRTSAEAIDGHLRWCRGDRSPPARALLDIGVIALRIVTVVPGRWGRGGLERHLLGGLGDDHRSPSPCGSPAPTRSPSRSPKWPDTNPDADMGAAPPMPTATPPMPTAAPRVPWNGAGEQEHGQQPHDPDPLRRRAEALRLVLHGDLLLDTLDDHSPPSPGALLRG